MMHPTSYKNVEEEETSMKLSQGAAGSERRTQGVVEWLPRGLPNLQ
jgi:hypothetical protein